MTDHDGQSRRPLILSMAIAAVLFCGVGVFIGVNAARSVPTAARSKSPAHLPSLVESYLKEKANDPSSVSIQKVLYGWVTPEDDGHTHQYVLVAYRERNRFGAMSYAEEVYRIVDGRRIEHLDSELQRLFGNSSSRWSTNPTGPAGRP